MTPNRWGARSTMLSRRRVPGVVFEAQGDAATARRSFVEAVREMGPTLGEAHRALGEALSHLGAT